MYSVYQHWDPLKVCVVGQSHPPEFYSWIKVPHVRSLFERIAIETEEDYQALTKKLQEFGVEVLRPNLPFVNVDQYPGPRPPPPMTPRDTMIMIGERFYHTWQSSFAISYNAVKDESWPQCTTWEEFDQLPQRIQNECIDVFGFNIARIHDPINVYSKIVEQVRNQGNCIAEAPDPLVNGANIARIGRDLFVGTPRYDFDVSKISFRHLPEFEQYRTTIINTGGHSDGTYCPVCPGLIVSLYDVPTYANTYPGWEVIYLKGQSWDQVRSFRDLKIKNKGKWWIPGFEYDQDVVNVVETWLSHWTGYVEETVFDVNMLIVDPKNIIVNNYNKLVFDALERYGITAHVVPFRHRYFWDGGLHCVTLDLHREGVMQDYFPNKQN